MFKYKGEKLVNLGPNGRVVTVKDNKDVEGQAVHVEKRNGSWSQRWRIVYAGKLTGSDAYTKKGSMSKRGFGFRALEPFYLRSKMPMNRVAECVGANNIVLKKYAKGRKAQQFQFDPVSKTIKGMYWTSYGFSMEGQNLRCRTLSSKWN
jgi:hypothetical protein